MAQPRVESVQAPRSCRNSQQSILALDGGKELDKCVWKDIQVAATYNNQEEEDNRREEASTDDQWRGSSDLLTSAVHDRNEQTNGGKSNDNCGLLIRHWRWAKRERYKRGLVKLALTEKVDVPCELQ